MGLRMLELGDVEIVEHGPQEADHLTCDGRGSDLFGLFGGESVADLVEPMLTLPGVSNHGRILVLLPAPEGGTCSGPAAIVPGGLDEHMTDPCVTGLGDGALSSSIARGVFAGHEAEVGHELTGALEATNVAEFGGEDHEIGRASCRERVYCEV